METTVTLANSSIVAMATDATKILVERNIPRHDCWVIFHVPDEKIKIYLKRRHGGIELLHSTQTLRINVGKRVLRVNEAARLCNNTQLVLEKKNGLYQLFVRPSSKKR